MKPTKTLLCMDTSGAFCTVGMVSYAPLDGVYSANTIKVLAETVMPMARGHAEHIMPAIVNILKLTHHHVADLDGVAATVGPGTFTGIRIALSTAKGLCLPHKIPCIGVDNAHAIIGEAIAQQAHLDNCLVISDTKRADYYVSTYQNGRIVGHQSLCFEDVVPLLDTPMSITGDGVDRFMAQWTEQMGQDIYPNTSPPIALPYTAPLSVTAIAVSALNNPLPPTPLYVRAPDVQPPKSGLVAQHSLKPKRGKKSAHKKSIRGGQ